jgi:hypothetical protein
MKCDIVLLGEAPGQIGLFPVQLLLGQKELSLFLLQYFCSLTSVY